MLVSVKASEIREDPSAGLWALILFLAEDSSRLTTPKLHVLWLAHNYDAEVLNGGHHQYFNNCGTLDVPETLSALREIGASDHARILEAAFQRFESSPIPPASSLEEFSIQAMEEPFGDLDDQYYSVAPEVLNLLEAWYRYNLSDHVKVVDDV